MQCTSQARPRPKTPKNCCWPSFFDTGQKVVSFPVLGRSPCLRATFRVSWGPPSPVPHSPLTPPTYPATATPHYLLYDGVRNQHTDLPTVTVLYFSGGQVKIQQADLPVWEVSQPESPSSTPIRHSSVFHPLVLYDFILGTAEKRETANASSRPRTDWISRTTSQPGRVDATGDHGKPISGLRSIISDFSTTTLLRSTGHPHTLKRDIAQGAGGRQPPPITSLFTGGETNLNPMSRTH